MTKTSPITTIQSALTWARSLLPEDTGHKEARTLLCEVMGITPEALVLYPDRALTVDQAAEFNRLITQRAGGEPLAYVLGRQAFYDFEVFVTPDVLIPRPETELLVEKALGWAGDRAVRIVDVGTGSGVVALALAKHLPNARVIAIEHSQAALKIAQRNGDHLNLTGSVRWLEGDLLGPLSAAGEMVDLVVSNPPYIASEELQTLEVARYEPLAALDGGADGLKVIRRLLGMAPSVLYPGGAVMLEIGWNQGSAIRELVEADFPALRVVSVDPDLAGNDRVVTLCHASES